MRLLNIGCGAHYHPAWTNIDVAPATREVLPWDVKKGLPFKDDSFDVVYHSHVLEHLSPQDATLFLKETARILKPAGVTRVVVPDLEQIVRLYLEKLEAARNDGRRASHEYEWMVLELIDQMTRSSPGGYMARCLRNADGELRYFIASRIGKEAANVWMNDEGGRSFFSKLGSLRAMTVLKLARNRLAAIAVEVIAGNDSLRAFREGLFRRSGEVHRWMYDRFSLALALHDAGYTDISQFRADTSRIPGFERYGLDAANGAGRKPDSLFMEAVKPGGKK